MKFQGIVPARLGFVLLSLAAGIWAQPQPPLTGTNAACVSAPLADTLSPAEAALDDSGFVRIFNGKNLKGWWEGCGSSHSNNDKTNGGIWLVDSTTGVLFSNQPTSRAGSVLMTNKSYGNYELIFEAWLSFGNDGGVFNRVTPAGSCYQTTLDYIQGSSLGGVYFEGGYGGTTRNVDPFTFGANKATISIGTNSNTNNRLDTITKRFSNPTEYGCNATGCAPANWTAMWDTGGWNQVRIQFFGTGASAANKVHNFAWIRKLGSTKWIPTVRDSAQVNTPAAPLGFQIHGGQSSWGNQNGHWYRNIRIRPLTDDGVPIIQPSAVSPGARSTAAARGIRAVSGALTGNIPENFEITVRDAAGRELERFSGRAGAFHHVLGTRAQGVLLVQVRTARGVDNLRVPRIF
jgi:hypothetical protein